MKKRLVLLMTAISVVLLLSACGKKQEEAALPDNPENAKPDITAEEKAQEIDERKAQEKEERIENQTERGVVCEEYNFDDTLIYIRDHKDQELMLNFEAAEYEVGERSADISFDADIEAIEAQSLKDEFKTLRFTRADNEGSTVDTDVYTNPETHMIDKIDMTEYCAAGRDRSIFYFADGSLVYAYTFKSDFYGTQYEDTSLPGKKCYFKDEVMTKCILNDADVDLKNIAYELSDYDEMDDFTKGQYDQLEQKMINTAYAVYAGVRNVPGRAMISGYVGDEYGGVLSHVELTLTSLANDYEYHFETNGDGYFEEWIPINEADDYGLVCKYGTFADATVDDIRIRPGTIGYSLGVIYMAEPGKNVHDLNTYLLNANYSSPKKLSEGEYCITFSYEDASVDLKPYTVDTKKGKLESDTMSVVKPGADDVIKYYIADNRGGHTDNPMTYELSGSRGIVRVYGKDGLVAAFNTPVGSAGTVWEVFTIVRGEIVPKNTMYQINVKEPFFN